MKKILLSLSLVLTFTLSANQEQSLEDIATDVVNLDEENKTKEMQDPKYANNILGMKANDFKALKKEFLKNFAECQHFSKVFDLKEGGRGHLFIRGYSEKKNSKYETIEVCTIDVKVKPDFAEYCQYPRREMISMYGFYSQDFFIKGEDDTRYSTQNCRRFY